MLWSGLTASAGKDECSAMCAQAQVQYIYMYSHSSEIEADFDQLKNLYGTWYSQAATHPSNAVSAQAQEQHIDGHSSQIEADFDQIKSLRHLVFPGGHPSKY